MQPTQPLQRSLRRLALTTKQGPHNYYKGNRTGSMGSHTKYGGYRIDYRKVRTYVVPEYDESFALTPFVTNVLKQSKGSWKDGKIDGPMNGTRYLQEWKKAKLAGKLYNE